MSSKYKKQDTYNTKMNNLGFRRRPVWAHEDDWQQVLNYAEKLRKKRLKKISSQTS